MFMKSETTIVVPVFCMLRKMAVPALYKPRKRNEQSVNRKYTAHASMTSASTPP